MNQLRSFCVMVLVCCILVAGNTVGHSVNVDQPIIADQNQLESLSAQGKFESPKEQPCFNSKNNKAEHYSLSIINFLAVELGIEPVQVVIARLLNETAYLTYTFLFNKLQLQQVALSIAG